jgi:iron complex outermembrane receptor protein
MFQRFPRGRALCAGLLLLACRAQADDQLAEVVVTSSPFRSSVDDVVQPVSVLAGDDLHLATGSSIGETLSHQPGLSATYYGPAASRPLIRGLGGDRVRMLEDGVAALDVSALSEDHAVSAEDAVAQQLEVLKGPSTLLYDSGAVGGAVNIVTRRIPTARVAGDFKGTLELRGDSASRERSAVGALDAGADAYAFHADGYDRRTDDVSIPGGRIWNSAGRASGGSLGGSLLGSEGYIGAAVSRFDDHYGIPLAAPDPAGRPRIDMRQDRVAIRGAYTPDGDSLSEVRVAATHSSYEHVESEADGSIGTRFTQAGEELRVTADHRLWGLKGTVGLQYRQIDFAARGSEVFVPASLTRDIGAFAFEQYPHDALTIEAGLRIERQHITPDTASGLPARSATPTSASIGALWRLSPTLAVTANLTRSARAPSAPELYADGPHGATRQFIVGDPTLDTETATSYDFGIRAGERVTWSLALYRNAFDSFVYLAPTGTQSGNLPVFDYRQGRATLDGFEAEAEMPLLDADARALTLRLAADGVRGRLRAGANLPQMPPLRAGAELRGRWGDWVAEASAWHYLRQGQTAAFETPTAGYTLLGASLSRHWTLEHGTLLTFVNGSNLGDSLARRHSSPLKDFAPLPGRSVTVGLRLEL